MKTTKILLAIDALEYNKVAEFNCKNLKQIYYGKTDISEFSQPRTMVLWSSFITGKNKEKEILIKGDKEMWNTKIELKDTFFSNFKNPIILDLPGFNYNKEVHAKSRNLLKSFFEEKSQEEKEKIKQEYNKDAFNHHQKIKEELLNALNKSPDFILTYFSIADVIGHLNFGNKPLMKKIYKDFDELAGRFKNEKLIILSDHGMVQIGQFGDHSGYGFWSTNFKNLGTPKLTDFNKLIK